MKTKTDKEFVCIQWFTCSDSDEQFTNQKSCSVTVQTMTFNWNSKESTRTLTQWAHSKRGCNDKPLQQHTVTLETADIQRWLLHVQLVYTSFYIKSTLLIQVNSSLQLRTAHLTSVLLKCLRDQLPYIFTDILHQSSLLKNRFPLQNILNKTLFEPNRFRNPLKLCANTFQQELDSTSKCDFPN